MYDEIFEELAVLSKRTARFRKVVLHLHSPESFDWASGQCDPAKNDKHYFYSPGNSAAFADELRKHFDMVAITDHMRCGYAPKVSQGVVRENDFMVLPGMELNLKPEAALGVARIHLIVILPQGSTKETFARLFAGLSIPADDIDRTGREEIIGISLKDWVRKVHEEKGLCIAAHVDGDRGVRRLFRHTAKKTLKLFSDGDSIQPEQENDIPGELRRYLLESGIDAVEVARSADTPHYCWLSDETDSKRSIATILSFDAHCVEEFERHDRITYMKMTHLKIQGLRDALTFPRTRIRFPSTLPSPPSPRLLGIQIEGTEASFFQDLVVAFSPDLNCLIGPRGSGKSTLVEALRYVFGYNRTLDQLDDRLASSIRDMQKANLKGSLIRVLYQTRQDDQRVLQATFDEKSSYSTRVYSREGDYLEVADVEKSGDFPVRLFGWSEIETLGRSPARQRDLLDRLVPDLSQLLQKRDEIRLRLRSSRAAVEKTVQELNAAYETSGREIQRYLECKNDFEKLNTEEVRELFTALDFGKGKKRILTQIRVNAENLLERLGDPARLSLTTDLETILEQANQDLRDWWLAQEMPRLGVTSVMHDIRAAVEKAIERVRLFSQQVQQHVDEVERETQNIERGLREQFAKDSATLRIADLRANAEKRLQRVSRLRENYLKCFDNLSEALVARAEITKDLLSVQNEIAGIRARHNESVERTLNEFLPVNMRVSIQFRPGGDTEETENTLNPLLAAAPRYKARKLARAAAESFSPVEMARMLGNGNLTRLLGKSAAGEPAASRFTNDDIASIVEKTRAFDKDEHADVQILAEAGSRLMRILVLQETPWDDSETILLNGQPVNEASPGQRSSAMLPLIALAEETPLVIDQPEDNLDKRLIGNVLVGVLAELKERRQILVCTHDPNILVGGDAEQVIVLDAESDRRGKVTLHGSIDNEDIVQTVIDLLEGGREAFETRCRRYGA